MIACNTHIVNTQSENLDHPESSRVVRVNDSSLNERGDVKTGPTLITDQDSLFDRLDGDQMISPSTPTEDRYRDMLKGALYSKR